MEMAGDVLPHEPVKLTMSGRAAGSWTCGACGQALQRHERVGGGCYTGEGALRLRVGVKAAQAVGGIGLEVGPAESSEATVVTYVPMIAMLV
jgi:hypothetical protein